MVNRKYTMSLLEENQASRDIGREAVVMWHMFSGPYFETLKSVYPDLNLHLLR